MRRVIFNGLEVLIQMPSVVDFVFKQSFLSMGLKPEWADKWGPFSRIQWIIIPISSFVITSINSCSCK